MDRFVLSALVALFAVPAVSAEVPRITNYQGMLSDTAGKPLPDSEYTLTFRIYDVTSGGAPLWEEVQQAITVSGLFQVLLGSVTPFGDSLFADTNRWIGVAMANDPELSPRHRLVTVPFSFASATSTTAAFASNADLVDGVEAASLEESAEIVAQIQSAADSTFAAQFQNLFQYYGVYSGPVTLTLFSVPAGKTLYITSVAYTSPSGSARLIVNGTPVFPLPSGYWSSGGAAPIQVLGGQFVEMQGDSGEIALLGYLF